MGIIALLLLVYLAAVSVGCMIVSAGYVIDWMLKFIGYVIDAMREFSVWHAVDPRKDIELVRAIWRAAVRLFKFIRSK